MCTPGPDAGCDITKDCDSNAECMYQGGSHRWEKCLKIVWLVHAKYWLFWGIYVLSSISKKFKLFWIICICLLCSEFKIIWILANLALHMAFVLVKIQPVMDRVLPWLIVN